MSSKVCRSRSARTPTCAPTPATREGADLTRGCRPRIIGMRALANQHSALASPTLAPRICTRVAWWEEQAAGLQSLFRKRTHPQHMPSAARRGSIASLVGHWPRADVTATRSLSTRGVNKAVPLASVHRSDFPRHTTASGVWRSPPHFMRGYSERR